MGSEPKILIVDDHDEERPIFTDFVAFLSGMGVVA